VTRNAMSHVAWSCDGKKLAAVGMDKTARVWQPDKSVRKSGVVTWTTPLSPFFLQLDIRSCANYSSGGHIDDIDYVAWNPTHPELFTTSSQKDKRVVFWDARRVCFSYPILLVSLEFYSFYYRKSVYSAVRR
jgi:THO complex subunit 3